MEAVSKPITKPVKSKKIRPFDVRRDLEQVANLVEFCFADTLDIDGKRYLSRMRNAAKNNSLLRWATMATELANLPLTGYVWQENERLVGNITLIPYFVRGKRFFLIANVAVHPDYRRHGIARDLTLQAMKHAQVRGAPSIWLHVREENATAVKLYQTLGFNEQTRRTSWSSTTEIQANETYNKALIQAPIAQFWKLQRSWLLSSYPPELSWHMPLDVNSLNPGLLGKISRFFHRTNILQWAVFQKKQLLGTLSWQATTSHANALWLAVPRYADDSTVYTLLMHARRFAPSTHALMLEYPARLFAEAIQRAGFSAQQTLIWMSHSFPKD